jgi:ribosomal protein S18 acetylase RimI-like enzyme/nitroimidazol reductase NimA-like FMN-containing flavoprotein (pyridoxamine 5'-phosphate oxidase superfamily)
MRRREFLGTRELAEQLFGSAEVLHVAGTDEAGQVVLKTFHGVVDDGWVWFHAAPAGEKTLLLGREVVVSVEEQVARVPSFFLDAQRACPATTFFRAAQVRGVLTALEAPEAKARVLQRLMEKLQPEGGFTPIDAASPLYAAAVKGLLIAGVSLEAAVAKVKLGQNRSGEVRAAIVEQLWRRGAAGDARAVEAVLEATDTPVPAFLRGPGDVRLHAALDERHLDQAVALLRGTYWNDVFSEAELRRAHLGSSAWVGALDDSGALVATARAIADGGKYAWVYDVCVAEAWRNRGLGQAVMRLLLDHPAVRSCRRVRLGTRDAQSLYRRFGFVDCATVSRPYATTEMLLVRAARD